MFKDWLVDKPEEQPLFPKLATKKTAAMMRKDLKSAGLEYCVAGNQYRDFHMWRHLYNTAIWTSGESTNVIKDLARHEDIRTTMGYTHTTPKQLHAAVNKMQQLPILTESKA